MWGVSTSWVEATFSIPGHTGMIVAEAWLAVVIVVV